MDINAHNVIIPIKIVKAKLNTKTPRGYVNKHH